VGAKRNHHLSALVALYAESAGIALRTAQLHAQRSNPKWLEFAKRNGVSLDGESEPQEITVGVVGGPEKPIEHQMEEGHRDLWSEAMSKATAATKRGDLAVASALGKLAKEQLEAYEKAKRLRMARDIEDRELIRSHEWSGLLDFVARIAGMITGLDRELADRVNPENPGVAAAAIRDWIDTKWNPAVEALPALA
jgi:hypothetical protein